jgi:hypothetical protein
MSFLDKLGSLDSLGHLSAAAEANAQPAAPAQKEPGSFGKLEADFEAALRNLKGKVAEQTRTDSGATTLGMVAKECTEARIDACHRAMREDIEKMHDRLATGLAPEGIDSIAAFLRDLDATLAAGKDSNSLLPRLRSAIATKLRAEAGELAVVRVVALLEAERLVWPLPRCHRPSADRAEIERSRRLRLAEVRESFIAHDLGRTVERMLGVVRAWGGDYPDRGSPLWEETALEGVAAGIRGQLLGEFVEVLRRERNRLLAQTEASIRKELFALQTAVVRDVHSLDHFNTALANSLHSLDEEISGIAWKLVLGAHGNVGQSGLPGRRQSGQTVTADDVFGNVANVAAVQSVFLGRG